MARRSPKAIGTAGESAVTMWLRDNGWPGARRHLVRHGRADLSALLPGLAAATNGRAVARR